MGSTFEETVFDFDLNFLHHPSNVVSDARIDKQRKAILLAKKKTVATDSLIKKYYGKKEQLEQTEVVLLAAKEECKQVCIDYKDSLEKNAQLEKDFQLLRNENKELKSNCDIAQNKVEAIKSHSQQLQVLVKEHETVIEALKIENKLEKSNVKDLEKNLSTLQKENETLQNDLCLVRDIALGKKKLHKRYKVLLQKYEKTKRKYENDSSSDSSSEENELFSSTPSALLFTHEPLSKCKDKANKLNLHVHEVSGKKDLTRINEDNESDYSNEIVSEDTGRGSSLAFSEGEKCFNSPDYFCNDSTFGLECNKTKETRVFVDACTSPATVSEVAHTATSPLCFVGEVLLSNHNVTGPIETDCNSTDTEHFATGMPLSTKIVISKEKKKSVDVGTNTVSDTEKFFITTSPIADVTLQKMTDSATSAIPIHMQNYNINKINTLCEVNTEESCHTVTNKKVDDALTHTELRHATIQNLSSQCELEICGKSIEERVCLEENNSSILCNDNSNDCEIEMILNSMRLTDTLITPIPKTPLTIIKKGVCKNMSPIKHPSELHKGHSVCHEALKLREENKALQRSIANLSKEILNIKCILKNQLLMPESLNNVECEKRMNFKVNPELFDNSSQDAIFINVYGEQTSDIVNNKDADEQHVFNSDSINEESALLLPSEECNVVAELELENEQVSTNTNQSDEGIFLSTTSKETPIVESKLLDSKKIIKNQLGAASDIEETLDCNSVKEYIILHDKKDQNTKNSKLSRLERFRKKLIPKSKIKRIIAPNRKLRSKAKPINVTKCQTTDGEILMNNKIAYENALKVMAEIKQKKANSIYEKLQKVAKGKKTEPNETNNNRIDIRRNSREGLLYNNKSNIEMNQPIVCSDQVSLDNIGEKEKQMAHLTDTNSKKSKNTDTSPTKNVINTRSRSKIAQDSATDVTVNNSRLKNIEIMSKESEEFSKECGKPEEERKRLKRGASDSNIAPVDCKRILRSQNVRDLFIDQLNTKEDIATTYSNLDTSNNESPKQHLIEEHTDLNNYNKQVNKRNTKIDPNTMSAQTNIEVHPIPINHPKDSILCKMLEKYGKAKIKFSAKKIPDDVSNMICKKLEDDIAKIIELPIDKTKSAMNKLVEDIQHSWKLKNFLAGLLKYLKDPARKRELFSKVCSPPAPPMTKSEQVLLYTLRQLKMTQPNIISTVLTHIEFSLFQLNRSPEFDVIESLSHIYALLCRYFGLKNRLRLFILDAMYCLQFKVIPLIKQCLDVWMHILPLAHMGIAKSPLVTCLVYLLHFYKCEDKLNRIQDIRFMLNKKYFYQVTDWNETKILAMFRNSIKEFREIKVEKKMLRVAFIILAKRQGPKWCQKNIIKNMLIPMIEKEDVPMRIKQFCVELLGPLLKPYPIDMKVHCEIVVNQLLDMLDQNTPDSMKEAIFTSLIYMNKHNQSRVTQSLLSWSPKYLSSEFEELMRDFVREKPIKVWKGILSRSVL